MLNADLIERLDSTPDTVVTLVDGKKYVVAEPMPDVVRRVCDWRGSIIAASALPATEHHGPSPRGHLAAVAPHPTSAGEE